MERRVTSHTEEEEMNQRRRLLVLARKGDEKAITRLLDLYQVRVYSGEHLRKSKIWKISKKNHARYQENSPKNSQEDQGFQNDQNPPLAEPSCSEYHP